MELLVGIPDESEDKHRTKTQMNTKTFTFILFISISLNVMETTAGNGFYKGYIIKSVMNSTKRNKKAVEVEKICQTKILHTFDNTTITEETCIKPKIYLTPTQKMLRRVFAMAVITMAIMGCLNMDSRDREEMFDIWMGMVAADVVDSFFEDD